MDDNVEKLADHVHDVWGRWINYMFGSCTRNDDGTLTIPKDKVDRWNRQRSTHYSDLSEDEMESDRVIAREMLVLFDINQCYMEECQKNHELSKKEAVVRMKLKEKEDRIAELEKEIKSGKGSE